MNINDEMGQLAMVGGSGYQADDDLVASLLRRTRRARAVRQSTVAAVGSVGAVALGAAAAQAIEASNDDPAFQDRNIINNRDGLTPIQEFRAKFGGDTSTPTDGSDSSIDAIVANLRAAAKVSTREPGKGEKDSSSSSSEDPKATTTTDNDSSPTAAELLAQCEAEHPDKEYKYYDCAKGVWVVKDGWFYNDEEGSYMQCDAQPDYEGYYYDCAKGSWVAETGYFIFGNGHTYKTITWTDAATGASVSGNWSGTGYGWDKKAILSNPSSNTWSEYKYMGSNATWASSTCTGITAEKYGATMQLSCLPTWKVEALGFDNGSSKVDNEWILLDADLKWHPCLCIYADPANPPEGWEWDGSAWVETTEEAAA